MEIGGSRSVGSDIQRLPVVCLSHAISLTSPRDACRLEAISAAFRSAAVSDDVWKRFLPPDYANIIARAVDRVEFTLMKDLYFRLCDPILIDGGKMGFCVDRETGAKCFILPARELGIVWGDTPQYWRWIHHPESRFSEVAELLDVRWLEIHGNINSKMLSKWTNYSAYLIFKLLNNAMGLCDPLQEVSVKIGAHVSKFSVRLMGVDRLNFQMLQRELFDFAIRNMELFDVQMFQELPEDAEEPQHDPMEPPEDAEEDQTAQWLEEPQHDQWPYPPPEDAEETQHDPMESPEDVEEDQTAQCLEEPQHDQWPYPPLKDAEGPQHDQWPPEDPEESLYFEWPNPHEQTLDLTQGELRMVCKPNARQDGWMEILLGSSTMKRGMMGRLICLFRRSKAGIGRVALLCRESRSGLRSKELIMGSLILFSFSCFEICLIVCEILKQLCLFHLSNFVWLQFFPA